MCLDDLISEFLLKKLQLFSLNTQILLFEPMTGSHGPRELSKVLVQEWKPVLLHLVPLWPCLWKEEDYHLASYLTEMELDRESRGLQDPCSGPTLQMHQGSRREQFSELLHMLSWEGAGMEATAYL